MTAASALLARWREVDINRRQLEDRLRAQLGPTGEQLIRAARGR